MTAPSRGLLLVRPVETDETLPGGRIQLVAETRERMTAWQCEVVALGAAPVCDDKDCERLEHGWDDDVKMLTHRARGRRISETGCPHPRYLHVGDWLLVRPRSYIAGPDPERAEWYVHQDDVLAILEED